MRDCSVFYRRRDDKLCIVLVYVDDLLVTWNDEESIQDLNRRLHETFTIKDLGGLRYFLGIEIARNDKGTDISQRKYTIDLVNDMGMKESKPTSFPFPKGMKLSSDQGELLEDSESYKRLIGRLLYLNLSRPDISFFVQQLSQFMANPRKPHMQAALHVVRYLKGT